MVSTEGKTERQSPERSKRASTRERRRNRSATTLNLRPSRPNCHGFAFRNASRGFGAAMRPAAFFASARVDVESQSKPSIFLSALPEAEFFPGNAEESTQKSPQWTGS